MKVGIIIYHKNIFDIYKPDWVQKCLDSIRNQTYQKFVVYELCYSTNRQQLWPGSEYSHIPMSNHICSMNHLIDKAFLDDCNVVANINLDDHFHPERLQLQLDAVQEGYDLISSNFEHIEEINGIDTHVRDMIFHDRDIKKELNEGHNVLAHPVIMMTKHFWDTYKYYDDTQLGYEDKSLWTKAINDGCKIKIVDKILLHYRLSENQTGRVYNSQGIKTK